MVESLCFEKRARDLVVLCLRIERIVGGRRRDIKGLLERMRDWF
jgi:hypothetical protein